MSLSKNLFDIDNASSPIESIFKAAPSNNIKSYENDNT